MFLHARVKWLLVILNECTDFSAYISFVISCQRKTHIYTIAGISLFILNNSIVIKFLT